MDNRLTIRDLTGILSKKTGKDADAVERFLNEFLTIIRENLMADKLMQIKDLGTFKVIQVDSRESVDVNTKERIVISAHSKISFTPDKALKEMVNKPFSFFQSIEVNDDSDFSSFEEPVEEKDDEMEDVEETEEVEETPEVPEAPEEVPEPEKIIEHIEPVIPVINEEPPVEEELPVEEEPLVEEEVIEEVIEKLITEKPEEEVKEEETILYAVERKTDYETNNDVSDITNNELLEETKEKELELTEVTNLINENKMSEHNENRRERDTYNTTRVESGSNNTLMILLLVLVVILIIALGSVLFLNRDTLFKGSVAEDTKKENLQNQFTLPADPDAETLEDEWGIEDEYAVEERANSTVSNKENVIATVTTKRGDRLNLLALEYYGNKLFWVYIYEHNKSKIGNPDNIDVGLQLDIPAKSLYNIDANDAASVRRASIKQSEIMSNYKKPKRRRSSYSQYKYTDPYMNQYSDPYQYSGGQSYDSGIYGSQFADPFQSTSQYNTNDLYNNNSSLYNNDNLYNDSQYNSNLYDDNNLNNNQNQYQYTDPFYF